MDYMILLITVIEAVIIFEKTTWLHVSLVFYSNEIMSTRFVM